MIIIPAIDIKNGKCVRLVQGDYNQQTVYSQNPIEVALRWKKLGAGLIHVVDLDGAKDGLPVNFSLITKIAKQVSVEVGGGIRSVETIQKYLDAGVNRVVLGTALLGDFDFARQVFEKFGDKIVLGLDAKNGELMTKGWTSGSHLSFLETAKKMQELGAQKIIYTDILKDGSLTEPNYQSLKDLMEIVQIPIIASGGISNINQIKKLSEIGAEGVILGKSLYEGKIDLKEALNVS